MQARIPRIPCTRYVRLCVRPCWGILAPTGSAARLPTIDVCRRRADEGIALGTLVEATVA